MPDFNLLSEPWIIVLDKNCELREVSLTDALLNAHEYRELRGELPTQDVAVLRLLLAVLHSVFYYVDEKGDELWLDECDAMGRWRALWEMGRFPEKPIREYLEKWRDRFFLFHDTYPFYQIPEAKKGTKYTAAKLNGELSESNNKIRLFTGVSGKHKQSLSYAKAARWLLCVNGYDDTAAKPKEKGLPSPGAGWLGRMGLIYAAGNDLFETLMLNLVLLNEDREVWGSPGPLGRGRSRAGRRGRASRRRITRRSCLRCNRAGCCS